MDQGNPAEGLLASIGFKLVSATSNWPWSTVYIISAPKVSVGVV